MTENFINPFNITRAADFTDDEIYKYWVDLTNGGGFIDLVKPRLKMPMIILGGKGSGKTHIMRYLSFPLQKLRNSSNLADGIRSDGWLGLYMRCSGLNSRRFRGKRQTDEMWADVFGYYIELWFAQMVVDTCLEILSETSYLGDKEKSIAGEVRDLFDNPRDDFPNSLEGLGQHLAELQKELDRAINICTMSGTLDITIRTSSGKLIFGIPRLLSNAIPEFKDIVFVYLIDEYENLTELQQKLINTLIREKQNPCSFKIGARLYGVRTYSTYCSDEDNKEGSEYELLPLDERLRDNEPRYAEFIRRLVIRRLIQRGILVNPPETEKEVQRFLSRSFEAISSEGKAEQATQFVNKKYHDKERPYFEILRKVLEDGVKSSTAPGISSSNEIDTVIEKLSCSSYPLLEKLNCFILYQKWSAGRSILKSAESIRQDCLTYLNDDDKSTQYHDKLLHWKYDLLSQLRRECGQKQYYVSRVNYFVRFDDNYDGRLSVKKKHYVFF